MTEFSLVSGFNARNAILCCPDTEMKEIILEGLDLTRFDADICKQIEACLDSCAKEAKMAAVERLDATPALPGIPAWTAEQAGALDADELDLEQGRPRGIDGESGLILGVCRAHLGSLSSKQAIDRMRDSETLNAYFRARGRTMPSRSAISTTGPGSMFDVRGSEFDRNDSENQRPTLNAEHPTPK